MTVGMLFMVLALILFFLAGLGMPVIPRVEIWAWFCVVLGFILGAVPWPPWPPR